MEAITKHRNYARFEIVAKYMRKKKYIGKALENIRGDTLQKGRYYILEYHKPSPYPYVGKRVNKPKETKELRLLK
jgi:hypothetical protein